MGSNSGTAWAVFTSTKIKSACLPTSRLPRCFSCPKARAPFSVAICKTSLAGRAAGSIATPLARLEASRMASHMSRSLPLIAPSVPRVRCTPAFCICAVGAMPEASFRFDIGLWTTVVPDLAIRSISPSSTWTQCAKTVRSPRRPYASKCRITVRP